MEFGRKQCSSFKAMEIAGKSQPEVISGLDTKSHLR